MKKSALISITLAFALTSALPAQAQPSAKNTIFFEGLGNGILYTINYDRMVADTWSARVGLMQISVDEIDVDSGGLTQATVSLRLVPITANKLKGEGNHKLELGIGPMLILVSGDIEDTGGIDGAGVGVTGTVGYRYQRPDGGINFRIGLTPLFTPSFLPWGGLSLGYTF